LAFSATLLVVGRWTRLATLFALITFVSIEQRLPQLPDGGDNITRIVLIYMLFLLPPRANVKTGSLRVWFHNLAVLAIATQLVILYTTSGFMKAFGDKWHHGVAMYYVSQVEWFSLPALRQMFMRPLIVTLSTYIPMFYQLLFGVAILSPLKLPWLLLGIFFHLGVANYMGLVSFSTAMIGLECFLISDAEYRRTAKLASRLCEQIRCFACGFATRHSVPARPQPVYLIQTDIESPRSVESHLGER
jgi:low affinity Fe/Cu permease